MKIKGEYEFHIHIQNMFNTYTLVTKNHNFVTEQGLNLMLKCIGGINNDEQINRIVVGKGTGSISLSDTFSTFYSPTILYPDSVVLENGSLIFNITTNGEVIDETTEIGLLNNNVVSPTLITRDIHDKYMIPSTAMINLKYILTLENVIEELIEEEETDNYD